MKDILLTQLKDDNSFDITFNNGDIVVGDCENQNQILLFNTLPGCYPEHPTRGIGAIRQANSVIDSFDVQKLINEFALDGIVIKSAGFNSETKQLEITT